MLLFIFYGGDYRRRDVPVGRDLVEDTSLMVCEHAETAKEPSEVSSNNTAQAGDDDMAFDDTRSGASSRTCASPMGSMDGEHDSKSTGDLVAFETDPAAEDGFALQ